MAGAKLQLGGGHLAGRWHALGGPMMVMGKTVIMLRRMGGLIRTNGNPGAFLQKIALSESRSPDDVSDKHNEYSIGCDKIGLVP